jgi:glyoxylase-like metal-dependent hydrolase (beta-lactamase superfamily II)
LIQHPEKGWILYDTGYTQRFHEATKSYPNKIYADMTKVVINPENEVKAQLERNGIAIGDIKHIIITHFHGDHVAGLLDFPDATFYASRAALDQVLNVPNWRAFTKGILKDLIPKDLKERTVVVDEACQASNHSTLGLKYDLFGDDSISMIPLPGHAAGQMGVMLETARHHYFLIADASWLKKTYQSLKLPNPIVRLFFDSWSDFKSSLNKVHAYHKQHPQTIIVPTHCAETTDGLVSEKMNLDEL